MLRLPCLEGGKVAVPELLICLSTPCKPNALEPLHTTGEEFVFPARVSLLCAPLSQIQAPECGFLWGILSPVLRLPCLEGGKVAVPELLICLSTPCKPDALETLLTTGKEFVFLARMSLVFSMNASAALQHVTGLLHGCLLVYGWHVQVRRGLYTPQRFVHDASICLRCSPQV